MGFDWELELLQGGVWTPFLVNQSAHSFPNFTINGLFAGTFQLTTYVTGGVGGTPVSTWTNIVIELLDYFNNFSSFLWAILNTSYRSG